MRNHIFLFVMLLASFAVFGCLNPDNGNGVQNTTQTVQYGDNVTVDYTLTVDGKVIDTSNADVAKNAGIYNANRSYMPLTFTVLLGGNIIPGFANGVIGMKVGESKNFTVSPVDGYGLSDPSKITNMTRYYNMSVFEEAPIEYFIANNITVANGTVIPSPVGYVGIQNFTSEIVTLRYLFSPGHQFAANGLPQTVMNITNETMLIRFDMEENKTYQVVDPMTGQKTSGTVTYADNDTIILDQNGPLAGKDLHFEVTMRAISR